MRGPPEAPVGGRGAGPPAPDPSTAAAKLAWRAGRSREVRALTRTERLLLLTESSESYTKSNQTKGRFRRILDRRLGAALAAHAPSAEVVRERRRLLVRVGDAEETTAAAAAVSRTFGIHRVTQVTQLSDGSLDELLDEVAELTRERVAGRTFAARVRARGGQSWSGTQASADLGTRLVPYAAGVDLDNPDVEVRIEAFGDAAFLVDRVWPGPGGLPLGTQERVVTLMSGGFDSAVAAAMVMARGCPTDFAHLTLECAQSDHATAVAHQLARDWAAGTQPRLWLLDLQPARSALLEHVPSALRQVALKQLMLAAVDRLADRAGYAALVTGESVGQVSSQTLANLVEIDRAADAMVLRPLTGLTKDEIIERARRLGTHDLSARAKEVCDLSDGPVSVAATTTELSAATDDLFEPLVDAALAGLEVVDLSAWRPGAPTVPVVDLVPAHAPLVRIEQPDDADSVPATGPVTLAGGAAARVATTLAAEGRDVHLLLPRTAGGPRAVTSAA